jgi:hypothetical protein
MSQTLHLDPERFLPADARTRSIAVRLHSAVAQLPIVAIDLAYRLPRAAYRL